MDHICAVPSTREGDTSPGAGQEDRAAMVSCVLRGYRRERRRESSVLGLHHFLLFCVPGQTESGAPGAVGGLPRLPEPSRGACLHSAVAGSRPPLVVCSVGVEPLSSLGTGVSVVTSPFPLFGSSLPLSLLL